MFPTLFNLVIEIFFCQKINKILVLLIVNYLNYMAVHTMLYSSKKCVLILALPDFSE